MNPDPNLDSLGPYGFPISTDHGTMPDSAQPIALRNGPAMAAAMYQPDQGTDQAQAAQAAQSPQIARLQTPNPGPDPSNVWVTVPIDKVSVANGKGTVQPVYGPVSGSHPGTYQEGQHNQIPPLPAVGRP